MSRTCEGGRVSNWIGQWQRGAKEGDKAQAMIEEAECSGI